MKTKSILFGIIASGLITFTSYAQESGNRERNQEPPSVDEIFKEMDANEDGKLSKKEVKGPLKDMFSKIDSDEDGYLSKEEIKNAPKPEDKRPKY
ncbi:hypothetical protein BWZ22_12100 [Seonamhaeicola sp. S2-3]|uniref:EF-hand domain-containing protein n=1 Tax=Seonamhaeicola sp. S2-3 TaxID=1936081 RepID=UPI000972974A|nr:EF-hand domain-containing protein [Seonamhaeicola sp. S2-3]APY11924.1 hypothetical protein BWZ22_12100 [Seonamhaeicola sp. S2-3]